MILRIRQIRRPDARAVELAFTVKRGLVDVATPVGVKAPAGVTRISIIIINHVIEAAALLIRVVPHFNTRTATKGHGQVTIQRQAVFGRGTQAQRLPVIVFAPALAEKVADGAFHRGLARAVPVHAQHHVAPVHGIVMGDREPDVTHDAGAFDGGNRDGFTGGDFDRVGITAGAVITGNAPRARGAHAGKL